MLMRAIASIDDRDVEHATEIERRTAGPVAEHDHVGIERLNVLRRIAQGLALGGAGAGGVEGYDVGAEALGGHLEGDARAGAGLEEKIDDGLAAEGRNLLHAAAEDFFESGGRRVDLFDLGEAKFFQGDQVAAGPGHR